MRSFWVGVRSRHYRLYYGKTSYQKRSSKGLITMGSGILVATNKRLVFVDKGLMSLKVEDFPYGETAAAHPRSRAAGYSNKMNRETDYIQQRMIGKIYHIFN